MAYYCGIDLGSRRSEVAIINEAGKACLQRSVKNDIAEVSELLLPFRPELGVVVESTFQLVTGSSTDSWSTAMTSRSRTRTAWR